MNLLANFVAETEFIFYVELIVPKKFVAQNLHESRYQLIVFDSDWLVKE